MEYFYCFTAARSTRRFPWHVLSKQRSCAPFNGILINTDVGNPTVPDSTSCLNLRLVQDGYGEGCWYFCPNKEANDPFFLLFSKRACPSPRVPTPQASRFR